MVSFFPPTKLLWLFPWGHWQGCSGFSFPILKVNASKGLNLHPRNVKEVNCFNLITCGLWLCMGHQAVTCNELAIWKSSGELVKNRDARAHGLKFWFRTSENLFKNEKQSFPGGLNTEARFEPTGESSFFNRWLEWSLVAMETTVLPLSQTEFYFFFKYTSVSKIEDIILWREEYFLF